ncbi:hypothetical protein INS49_014951 [Diaporthe citri]|uniref:uncharacterized protein n=1 Tax=Diaporthe citri TaxID=83186 RepID=UPI001C7EE395|nr:uncharacterized protein INS49_014951 [Diaporthe citri]KAG6357074.1 hypothetical protein INS49_014951 [Diaporthe citri]
MTILQHMCSQDDPDNDTRRPRPARIVKSRPSTKGKEPAVAQASGHEPEPSQEPKTADSKSIGELFSPTRPTLRARLSSWSIRQKAQAPTAEAIPDMTNNRLLRVRSSEPIRRPPTPAHDPAAGPEVRPTLRTRFSAWSLHQRTGEGLAVLQRVSPSYQAFFPSGRLVVGER